MASLIVADSHAMTRLGQRLGAILGARQYDSFQIVGLSGELGAGKTTLVRGIFRGLEFDGRIKSPTYTLVEPYRVNGLSVYHVDLYRLGDPEELVYLGLEDLTSEPGLMLVEWPERAPGLIQALDFTIDIQFEDTGRRVDLSSTIAGTHVVEPMDFDGIEGVIVT